MFWSRILCALILFAQVLAVPTVADSRRPIWNIAHMVNAVHQIDHYLDMGANGLEFDISFSTKGTANYTFHGFPCDCFRDCMQREDFNTFLQRLRKLTTPGDPIFRKELVLLFMDFKVKGLSSSALSNSGEDVAKKLLQHYWNGGKSHTQAYIVISLPSTRHAEVIKSFLRSLEYENATEFISRVGFDFSGNDDISTIKNFLASDERLERSWLGDGITNCLPRGTRRLLAALKERDRPRGPISKVNWWTVDRKYTMKRVIRLGVDALITNYPENLRSVLKEDHFKQNVRLATFEDSPWTKYARAPGTSNSLQTGNSTFYDLSQVEEILYN